MKLKFLLLIATFMLSATIVNAQSSNGILVNVVPLNPAPYENTTITLNSYVNNLDSVLISWSENSKIVTSGIGKKSLSIKAPAIGEKTNVVATISLPNGTVTTEITIKPSIMVLLWQANDSYIPPFYKGKALPTPDSEIKVVAMPEIRIGSGNISSQNMTYSWKKDYTNNVDGSGYGKNFFVFVSDYLEDFNNISVVASTVDQKSSSNASIDIRTIQPKILFYKNDSNIGTIWEKTLTSPHKIQSTGLVEAIPYFMSPKEIQHPALIWNWFINGSRVNLTGPRKNLMPLQVEEGVHGTSKLSLEIENREKIFQAVNKEMDIEF